MGKRSAVCRTRVRRCGISRQPSDSKFLPARGALGQAYLETGNPERAIPELEAALAPDEDGRRHYQLARAYQAAGRLDRAAAVLADYREILRLNEAERLDEPRITPPARER